MAHQDLFAGLIWLDLLHRAAADSLHRQWTPADRARMPLAKNKVPELFRAPLA